MTTLITTSTGQQLVLYDQMRLAIQTCAKIDEAKEIKDQAEALVYYAMQKDDKDTAGWLAEIKLRAVHRIGEISKELEKAQGTRTKLVPTGGNKSKEQQLKDAGISQSAAQRYEAFASETSQETLDAYCASERKAKRIPTMKGLKEQKRQKPSKEDKEKWKEVKAMKLSKNKAATVRRSMHGLTETEKDSGFANYVFDGKQFLVSPLYSELENKDRGHLRMAGSETDESRILCKDWDVYHDSKIRDKIMKAIEPLLSFEVHALWQGKKPAFMVARDFNRAKGRRRIVDMICADFEHLAVVLEQMESRRIEQGLDPQVPPQDMVPRPQPLKDKKPKNSFTADSMAARLLREFNKEPLTVNEAAQRAFPNEAWSKLKTATARGTELQKAKFIEDSGESRDNCVVYQITESGRKAIGL